MLRFFVRSVRAAASKFPSLLRDRTGAAAIEFAVMSPAIFALAIGMLKFGIAVQHYILVTNAAAQGALTMGMARGSSTPYGSTTTTISSSAPGLTSSSITTTVKIGGTACSSDSACSALLTAGATVTVKVSYPCDLSIMGVNYMTTCTVSSTSGQIVQ